MTEILRASPCLISMTKWELSKSRCFEVLRILDDLQR
jgi:hypothetical protein